MYSGVVSKPLTNGLPAQLAEVQDCRSLGISRADVSDDTGDWYWFNFKLS